MGAPAARITTTAEIMTVMAFAMTAIITRGIATISMKERATVTETTAIDAATIGIIVRETTTAMTMLKEPLEALEAKVTVQLTTFQLAQKGPLLRQSQTPKLKILPMRGMLQLRTTASQ